MIRIYPTLHSREAYGSFAYDPNLQNHHVSVGWHYVALEKRLIAIWTERNELLALPINTHVLLGVRLDEMTNSDFISGTTTARAGFLRFSARGFSDKAPPTRRPADRSISYVTAVLKNPILSFT